MKVVFVPQSEITVDQIREQYDSRNEDGTFILPDLVDHGEYLEYHSVSGQTIIRIHHVGGNVTRVVWTGPASSMNGLGGSLGRTLLAPDSRH